MRSVRIATCAALPEVDIDEAPLAEAFARAGVDARLLAWDDPRVDWDAPVATILRSTWNYALDVERFLAWVDRVAAAGPLFNPSSIVHHNVNKRYLIDLALRGVAVVPTAVVAQGRGRELPTQANPGAASELTTPQVLDQLAAAGRIVVKPAVGAGSLGARVFAAGDRTATLHVAALAERSAVLVQPYLVSVDDYGERSIIAIGGELSHAIRKAPRFAGDSERVTGPFAIADDERAVAEAALAPHHDLLYARVDVARDSDGQPRVMELELVEPSLFFAYAPGSADRYVAELLRRLP